MVREGNVTKPGTSQQGSLSPRKGVSQFDLLVRSAAMWEEGEAGPVMGHGVGLLRCIR